MEKDENLSLPKATVSKIIKEMLPEDVKCSNDTRDLILECCVDFIHLVSSEANEVCTRENKKTIAPEHIIKALQELGFKHYIDEVNDTYQKHKVEVQEKPKARKLDAIKHISPEELLRNQQQLFEKARNKLTKSQEVYGVLGTSQGSLANSAGSLSSSLNFPAAPPPTPSTNPSTSPLHTSQNPERT